MQQQIGKLVAIFNNKQFFVGDIAFQNDFYRCLAWAITNKYDYALNFQNTFENYSKLKRKQIIHTVNLRISKN